MADAQSTPRGPILVASRWVDAVLKDGDLASVWPLAHPDLRLKMTNAWVTANMSHLALHGRDPDHLASSLAERTPTDPLWPAFAETQIREFRQVWSDVDYDTWGWGTDPRPLSPGRELALMFDVGGEYGVQKETAECRAIGIALEHSDAGWLVVDFTTDYDDPWAAQVR
jgi:hypothetical protein